VSDAGSRPLVPGFLLAGFADRAGQLMAERRDRTRRRLVPLGTALAELGSYRPVPPGGAAPLAAVLADAEARAAAAVSRVVAGAFPPTGPERASLALVLALQLCLGRGHRAAVRRTAELVGQLIVSTLEEAAAAREAEEEPGEGEGPAATGGGAAGPGPGAPEAGPAGPAALEVLLAGERHPTRCAVDPVLPLARQIAGRIWQLVRFESRVLLTSDTPVTLWAPSASAKPYQVGLGAADELRVPLDPRHALIVARHARAGEIVRDLGERHARALNRTIAESAVEWMYYHPESDPLEAVELASPESP
jgi:hypothetical protein